MLGKVQGNQVQASKRLVPVESNGMHFISPGMSCKNMLNVY